MAGKGPSPEIRTSPVKTGVGPCAFIMRPFGTADDRSAARQADYQTDLPRHPMLVILNDVKAMF